MHRYLRIGVFLLVAFLQSREVMAQGNDPPIPPVPTGGNVVLDELEWLTPEQEDEINAINQKLDEDGIAQIAVVTLQDCGVDKQKFRNDLFRAWGIGHQDDNDGLLILVCWYGGDENRRSVEQETGYGLEGTLPDILTTRIVKEEFVPQFQSGSPGVGLVAMVEKYDSLLRSSIATSPVSEPVAGAPWWQNNPNLIISCLAITIFIIASLVFIRAETMSHNYSHGKKKKRSDSSRGKKKDSNSNYGFWNYDRDSDRGSRDSNDHSSSFDGGDSGGGGSSTKF